eukprot:4764942-Heterocapsa_arctica.AAC.1
MGSVPRQGVVLRERRVHGSRSRVLLAGLAGGNEPGRLPVRNDSGGARREGRGRHFGGPFRARSRAIPSSRRQVVMYSSTVRPDLAYTVKELARRLASPTDADWLRMKRLLRYVRGTTNYLLKLTGHKVEGNAGGLDIYADACYGKAM